MNSENLKDIDFDLDDINFIYNLLDKHAKAEAMPVAMIENFMSATAKQQFPGIPDILLNNISKDYAKEFKDKIKDTIDDIRLLQGKLIKMRRILESEKAFKDLKRDTKL